MANREWLSLEFLREHRKNPNFSVKDLENHMMTTYALKVARATCYRAKVSALEKLRGSVQSHYTRLRSYVGELKRVDREGSFELEVNTVGENAYFNGFYICLVD